jgi:cyclophilin family peptidyl-prolyl cis-trans isomerase
MSETTDTAPAGNTLLLETKDGTITIELLSDLAPQHVERIRTLAERGFYDGTPFHRVIEGFMAQGGDPTGTGSGGSDLPDLPAEFSPPNKARFVRGTCGMARTNNPNSANSQFFIMFAPAPSLDGQYTIWGRVTAGMDIVDKREPDAIKSMRLGAAAAPAPAPEAAATPAEPQDSAPAADA